ncbi:hypothetical protein BLA60_34220 [Actinophytocola xinjiangensis]|uniref:Phosphotransferase family enzyme n=1 Tax=Actinophytocola xinjiangensis TaxID=485602 RepID=A0A7Z0WF30_9PSEU|nr:hypothetical protein BLA60_34220 [Actinophytocola xinjiangensis]
MRTRIEWAALPEETRVGIEGRTGPIRAVRGVAGGRNSPLAVVVEVDGGRVFVKGVRGDHRTVVTQDREAGIGPCVRSVAPAVLWHLPDVGGWNVLGFEYVDGRHADYSSGSADLPAVVDVMVRAGEIRVPATAPVRDARQAFRSYVDDVAAIWRTMTMSSTVTGRSGLRTRSRRKSTTFPCEAPNPPTTGWSSNASRNGLLGFTWAFGVVLVWGMR